MSSTLNPYFYAYNSELLAFENAWVNFVKKGEINETIISWEISQSWTRSKDLGIDPLSRDAQPIISQSNLKLRINQNQTLLNIIIPFMETLSNIVGKVGFRIIFTDREGVILKGSGDDESMSLCGKLNLFPGADYSQKVCGTNSIGLCAEIKKPTQMAGAQHYKHFYHTAAFSAAPILDEKNTILGVLSIASRCELMHRHTLGMVMATAEAIQNKLQILEINKELVKNNNQLRATLGIVTDGIVYIKDGKIIQLNDEMCKFLGKPMDEMIGKDVEKEIATTPELAKIVDDNLKHYRDNQITLKGKDRNHQCIFEIREICDTSDDYKKSVSKIMIFTRIEEIQMLAKKIKYTARYKFENILGQAACFTEALELAKKASEYEARVIIEGESGTGKEMFAQAIHNNGSRKDGSFVAVDCGSIPKELLESQLFGYEGGAFTGANKEGKAGLFELANKGTIFLDEIGNMPAEMQMKMLRVLQEGVFTRVGGTKPIQTDARIVAATNSNLKEGVENGSFRHDLYYRLNVFYIKTPPLRERKEDIPLLVEHFLKTSNIKTAKLPIEKIVMDALQNYDWPGNIRQLHNTIERALIMSADGKVRIQDLAVEITGQEPLKNNMIFSKQKTLNETMVEYVQYVFSVNGKNISKTAKTLGVSRVTVYKFLHER